MSRNTFAFILLFSFIFLQLSAQDLKQINVAQAYKDKAPIKLSTFAESIEYIPLETSMETLYSYPTVRGIQGDSIILVKSQNRTSIFNRKTGGFIRDIGHVGEDPNSYSSPGPLGFNTENGNVFVSGYQEVIEYSLNTDRIVHKIKQPDLMEIGGVRTTFSNGGYINTQINMLHWSGQGFFVGLVSNISGKDPIKLVIFDRQGEIIKYFKNNQTFEKKEAGNLRLYDNSYYEYAGMGHHKEWFSDTVFQFNKESIQPKYVFKTGKFSPPYKRQDFLTDEERSRLMFISLLQEDDRYIYFKMYHLNKFRVGLHDKQTEITSISETDTESLIGYYNDLDGFLPFVPQFKTPEGKLIGTLRAQDVLKWFDENRRKARDLPENLKKLENLDPEDNPVVMIVTPKYD